MLKTSVAVLFAGVFLAGCVYDRDPADGYSSSYERDRDRERSREQAWERDRERARERVRERERAMSSERTRAGEPARLHTGPSTGRPLRASTVQPDRVSSQDLAALNPGSGTPGPEADVRRPARATPSPTRLTSGNQRIFVQAASFVTREQAERARRMVAQYGRTQIYTAYVGDQLRYRVRVGPMATPERSERVRASLVRRGYNDAIIVRD